MRDIPIFTTENGVAALTLSEIPYKACAYIRLLSSLDPEMLLQECCDFCHAAGAEYIYATGHALLEQYPLYTQIWEMTANRENVEKTDAALFPATLKTAQQWRAYYNERMKDVPNAATMTEFRMQELLNEGSAYFVHREGELLGIGVASGGRIETVATVKKTCGREVLLALNNALTEEKVTVEVASVNCKAVALYQRMGFVKTRMIASWYKII